MRSSATIKIPWQAASFLSAYIKGGDAYAKGKAKTISGMVTDDKTGKITVHLVAPFAPMVDIFALPGTAPVPQSTPMKNLAATGTVGDGPVQVGSDQRPTTATRWSATRSSTSPACPRATPTSSSTTSTPTCWPTPRRCSTTRPTCSIRVTRCPPRSCSRSRARPLTAYKTVPLNSSWYFFFGVNQKPFNNLVRAPGRSGRDRRPGVLAPGLRLHDAGLPPDPVRDSRPLEPVDLPVPQPGRAAEHDAGQAADEEVRDDRPVGHGLRRGAQPRGGSTWTTSPRS